MKILMVKSRLLHVQRRCLVAGLRITNTIEKLIVLLRTGKYSKCCFSIKSNKTEKLKEIENK